MVRAGVPFRLERGTDVAAAAERIRREIAALLPAEMQPLDVTREASQARLGQRHSFSMAGSDVACPWHSGPGEMRDRLRQAALTDRPWLLAVAGISLGAVAAVWLFASFAIFPERGPGQNPSAPLSEPPPQAAASAPEPTLAAAQQAQPQTTPGDSAGDGRRVALRGHRGATRRAASSPRGWSSTPSWPAKSCGRSPSNTSCGPRPSCGPTTSAIRTCCWSANSSPFQRPMA